MHISLSDVKRAFLNTNAKRELYMELPPDPRTLGIRKAVLGGWRWRSTELGTQCHFGKSASPNT